MLSLLEKEAPARTLVLLERAYRRCGDGHGLLGAMAQVQLDRGNVTEALKAMKREMLAPHPSERAMWLAERLPSAEAQELQELGKTPQEPVHVPRMFVDGDVWVKQIVCRGVDPKAFNLSYPAPGHPELLRAWVECPPGQAHAVFFWQDEPAPPPPRRFSFDRPMPAVAAVLERVSRKFGITTAAELREALLDPSPSRSQAWLLEHVWDSPELIRVFGVLLQQDPDDLEALHFRAQAQAAIGDLDGAIATLARASTETARIRELRAFGGSLKPSAIRSYQCAFLFKQRKLEEARARCNEGLAAGSQTVSNAYLARIALWQGDLEGAEAFAREAVAHVGSYGYREWTLLAVVLSAQGRPHEAAEWARRAPNVLAARALLKRVNKPAREWLVFEENEDRAGAASELGECGHVYLELGLLDRAERCFALSEGLADGPADAERAVHLSETDASRALLALEPVLKRSHHPDVLVARAAIAHKLGKDSEALAWIERALAAFPGHEGAYSLLHDVCEKPSDAGCAATKQRLFPSAVSAGDGGNAPGGAPKPP